MGDLRQRARHVVDLNYCSFSGVMGALRLISGRPGPMGAKREGQVWSSPALLAGFWLSEELWVLLLFI